jgi:hypothetical protein
LVKFYSNKAAFAILKANGSIETWGHSYFGGKDAPAGRGYTKIYSTDRAFAALKASPYHGGLFCLQNLDYLTP